MISIERLMTVTPEELIYWMGDEGLNVAELRSKIQGDPKKTAMARVEVGGHATDMILFRSGYFDAVLTMTKLLDDNESYNFEVLFNEVTGEALLYPFTHSEFRHDDNDPVMLKPELEDEEPIMTTMFESLTWRDLAAVMRMAASLYGRVPV